MNEDGWKPASFFPSKDHMAYWKELLTMILLALAFPYMLRLVVKRPILAASVSSSI
jgi:hypothetical protein